MVWGSTFPLLLFPTSCIFASEKIKETIYLLKTNQNLINTIRTILEVFPEGVLIRSLDPKSRETILKFKNNIAKGFIMDKDNSKLEDVVIDQIDFSSKEVPENLASRINLKDFLSQQENKILSKLTELDILEQVVEIKSIQKELSNLNEYVRDINSNSILPSQFFNVKTLRVNWDDNKDSFLHLFINTTQIK